MFCKASLFNTFRFFILLTQDFFFKFDIYIFAFNLPFV